MGVGTPVGGGPTRGGTPVAEQALTTGADTLLRYAALLFAFGLVVHTADHVRRGVDVLTRHVFWGGAVLSTVSVLAIVLVLARHRLAPHVALFVAFPAAIGVTASHLLPEWSAFSDSLSEANADPLSWAAVLVEIVGAAALGAAAVVALRRPPDPAGRYTRSRS